MAVTKSLNVPNSDSLRVAPHYEYQLEMMVSHRKLTLKLVNQGAKGEHHKKPNQRRK